MSATLDTLNRQHRRHIYKSHTGKTLLDTITPFRIKKTMFLLSETEKPISEIVRMVGYNDVSSFSRKFKQYNGSSPGEYRKNN